MLSPSLLLIWYLTLPVDHHATCSQPSYNLATTYSQNILAVSGLSIFGLLSLLLFWSFDIPIQWYKATESNFWFIASCLAHSPDGNPISARPLLGSWSNWYSSMVSRLRWTVTAIWRLILVNVWERYLMTTPTRSICYLATVFGPFYVLFIVLMRYDYLSNVFQTVAPYENKSRIF
jgi:hypothetical protein